MWRELPEEFYRSLNISSARLFSGIEQPKVSFFAVGSYSSHPFTRFVVLSDAAISSFIAFGLYVILAVLALVSITQIFPTIIVTFSIYMIYQVCGPFSRHQKPCEAMRQHVMALKRNISVAVYTNTASYFSEFSFVWASPRIKYAFPCDMPSIRVIFESLFSGSKSRFHSKTITPWYSYMSRVVNS